MTQLNDIAYTGSGQHSRSNANTISQRALAFPDATLLKQNDPVILGSEANSTGNHTTGPVVQRMLMTHQRLDDEAVQVDDTGNEGYFNEYSRWLAKDTSVLVEGQPAGVPGLIRTLKAAAVAGGTVATELAESLISSGTWKELNDPDKRSLVNYMKDKTDMTEMEDDATPDDYIEANDFANYYAEDLLGWIGTKLESLSGAETIGAIGNIPLKWHADLAYLLYEATKELYYPRDEAVRYVPPFKKLIGDINQGNIESFEYKRRYGAVNQNWGAEFTVQAPAPMKEKYEDKAVVHTHYSDGDEIPNYAHTKPEDKKFEAGFGYTIVTLNQVNSKADANSKWDDLE